MSAESNVVTAEGSGFTITSNTSTAETLESILNPEGAKGEAGDLSRAASELGRAGGRAAAEARKAAEKKAATVGGGVEGEKAEAAKIGGGKDGAQTDPDHDKDPEPAAAKAEEEKGNPRHDSKARMLEATRKEAQAKRERDAERQRREALEHELDTLRRERAKPVEEPTKATDDDPEPQEGDFEHYPDFVKAAARWAARDEKRQLDAKAAEKSEGDRRRAEVRSQLESLTEAIVEAKTEDPEFVSKVSRDVAEVDPTWVCQATGVKVDGRAWIADEFLSAPENAPILMLHLSEHPDEFQRISALSSPRAVTRALAMIVAQKGKDAVTADASSKPEVSKAPPPVRSVTGAPSTVPVGGYRPGMDFDAWLKANPRKVAR